MFVLIGGKSNSQIIKNKIEKEIVSLSNKPNPIILFCPYAAIKQIDKAIDKFHKLMNNINCTIIDLTLDNVNQFEDLLIKADILYISGGWCDDLLKFFKENKLDIILKNHINDNKIYAGSSAGAMLYTKAGMGDKYVYSDNFHNYNYKMVNCLNILDITICPHYQHDDLYIYNDELKKYNISGYGIEEDTALVIEKDYFYVIKEEGYNSIYYFDKNKSYQMIPLYENIRYRR